MAVANWKKSKKSTEKLENQQLLSGCGFIQNIASSSHLVTGG